LSGSWRLILQQGICRFIRPASGHSAGIICLLAITLLCIGCSSDTTKWRVQLVPTSTINQDDAGAALPVVARVYHLKGKEKFQQATFKALWKGDKDVLGEDLVDRKEIMVHPDKKIDVYFDLDVKHGPVYLGVVMLFRQPEVEGWRQIVEASSSKLNPITPKVKLIVDKNTIKLAN
jgi:type VI secretion system protein VasD